MSYTRREFGKLALASLPAAAILARGDSIFGAVAQAKPNSLIDGVQIGTITYSFRSMPDQSAEATLKYIVDSGISAIELMGGPVESFAGAPASAGGRGAAGGLGGGGSGKGGWSVRGRWARCARFRQGRSGASRRSRGSPDSRRRAKGRLEGARVRDPLHRCSWRRRGPWGTRTRRTDPGAAGPGEQAEGVAHDSLDGRIQKAADDVQRRGRDDLCVEAAQSEHVERGARVRVQRRRSARVHAHDARTPDRCPAAPADRRHRDEEEDLCGLPHTFAGEHERVRSGVRGIERQHGER